MTARSNADSVGKRPFMNLHLIVGRRKITRRLPGLEADLLRILLRHETVSDDAVMTILYGSKSYRQKQIVKVTICKLRQSLEAFEVAISTQRGVGYSMLPEEKDKVRALMPPAELEDEAC